MAHSEDPAFSYDASDARWVELEGAWHAMGAMFWGPRVSLIECAHSLKQVIHRLNRLRDGS